jgi:hypothetical protein
MNLSKLPDLVGRRLRLRPETTVWKEKKCVPKDDNWILVSRTAEGITLVNERTDQDLSLSPDHIHSYTSSPPGDNSFDGFLELKVTIDITGDDPKIDIIRSGAARTIERANVPPLRVRITELLRTINPTILKAFDDGASEVAVMISEHNLRALLELQNEDGASGVFSLESTGSMSLGIGSRVGGHIHDNDDTATCHGYIIRFNAVRAALKQAHKTKVPQRDANPVYGKSHHGMAEDKTRVQKFITSIQDHWLLWVVCILVFGFLLLGQLAGAWKSITDVFHKPETQTTTTTRVTPPTPTQSVQLPTSTAEPTLTPPPVKPPETKTPKTKTPPKAVLPATPPPDNPQPQKPVLAITRYDVSPSEIGKRIGVHITIMNNGPSLPVFIAYFRPFTPNLVNNYQERRKYEDELWSGAEEQANGSQTLITVPAGLSNIDMESAYDLEADNQFVWYFAMALQDQNHKTILQSCFYIDPGTTGTKNTVTYCIDHNK